MNCGELVRLHSSTEPPKAKQKRNIEEIGRGKVAAGMAGGEWRGEVR